MEKRHPNEHFPAGPLNIDCEKHKMSTVMGAELNLTDDEFEALYILASNEDNPIKFDTLYNKIWKSGDAARDRIRAMHAMNNILRRVEEVGNGFMWIEHDVKRGFTFKTHWGHNWLEQQPAPHILSAAQKSSRHISIIKKAAGAVGLIAATLILIFSPPFSGTYEPEMPCDDFLYLFDEQVPLGAFPPLSPDCLLPCDCDDYPYCENNCAEVYYCENCE